jgi:hypothetical protein
MVTRCWCWWSSRRRGRDAERFHEVELQLIAFRAVDQDLIVSRQPRSPAALVLAGDTTTLDELKPVRIDRCRLASHVVRDLRTRRTLPAEYRGLEVACRGRCLTRLSSSVQARGAKAGAGAVATLDWGPSPGRTTGRKRPKIASRS